MLSYGSLRGGVALSLLFFLSFFSALITGCGSGGQIIAANSSTPSSNPSSGSASSFSVTAVSPANSSTQVALSAVIQITFSSAADPTAVDAANIRVTAPNAVAGAVTYNASNNTATFTPSAALQPDSTYTVTVSGVTSSTGIEMAGTFTSNFATVTSSAGSGGGGGGSASCPDYGLFVSFPACTQYLAYLWAGDSNYGSDVSPGTIYIVTDGNVTVQFQNVPSFTVQPNTTLTVQFCPAYSANSTASPPACFNAGTVTSDTSGNVNSTFKFPRSGSWAGDFRILSGSSVILETTWPPGTPQFLGPAAPITELLFALQPDTTVNGTGIATGSQEQDSLASGTVIYSEKFIVQFALNGAAPSATYTAYESVTRAVCDSCSNELGTFTTDASGNGSLGEESPYTFLSQAGGDIFTVEPQDSSHAGWIGGFLVPQ